MNCGNARLFGRFAFAALIGGFFSVTNLKLNAADSTEHTKPVLVYYMPWFVAKPYSTNWGWHWTMNRFDPDTTNAFGEQQIASWYYPLIGPYDSADPAVLEYHVLLMKLGGIDGVVVDWYGPDNFNDYAINNQRTKAIFEYARRAQLKFCLCFEDHIMQQEIDGGFISGTNALAHAQETLLYLQTNYWTDANYLRWDNRPVLLNFGPQYFRTNGQWQAIFSVLASSNKPALFTEDDRVQAGCGAFTWPPMWLSQAPGTGGVLSEAALNQYLLSFEQKAVSWPAFISSAFPRFHDIYQPARVRDYWGYLGDHNGEILRGTLARAMTNASTFVQIVTWNDFGEGTVVEPTREYGYRDLGIIQELRRQYLEPTFSRRTNDLTLARRIWDLRHTAGTHEKFAARLDQVFTNIVRGELETANATLNELEQKSAPKTAERARK